MNEIDKLSSSKLNNEKINFKVQFSTKSEYSNARKMNLYHPFTHDIVSCDIRTLSQSSSDEEMQINSPKLSNLIKSSKSTTELTENSYDSVFSSINSTQTNRLRLDSNSNSVTSHSDENNSSDERSFETVRNFLGRNASVVRNSYSEPIENNRAQIDQRFQDAWSSNGYSSIPASYDSSNEYLRNFNNVLNENKVNKSNDAENPVFSNQQCAVQDHLYYNTTNGLDNLSLAFPNMVSFNNRQLPKQDPLLSVQESKLFIQYLLNCFANNLQTQPRQQYQQQKLQKKTNSRELNEVDDQKFSLNLNHNEVSGANLIGRKVTGNKLVSNATNLENNAANSSVNNLLTNNLIEGVKFPPLPAPSTSNSTDLDQGVCAKNYYVDDLTYKNSNCIQKQSNLADTNISQRPISSLNLIDINLNQKSGFSIPIDMKQRGTKFYQNETYPRLEASNPINMSRRTVRSHQTNIRSNYKAPNLNCVSQPNPRLNAKQQKVFKEILLEIEIKKHQQQLMSRYGGKIKYDFKYIVDHDGLLPKGTSSFRMRIPHNSSCSFCANNNLPEEFARSHVLKDPNNLILCPILQNYECPICRSTGIRAHTVRYCHMNRQLALERAQLILNMMHVNPNNDQTKKSQNENQNESARKSESN